jgi:hypothetical protein
MKHTTDHISDDELAAALSNGHESHAHVRECQQCREEESSLRQAISSMQRHVSTLAERPEAFWKWQIEAALRRGQSRQQPWVPAFAGVLTLLLLSVLLLGKPVDSRAPVNAVRSAPAALSDDAVLAEIEQTLYRAAPEALQPAALIADELLGVGKNRRTEVPKEKSNET